MVPVKNPRTTPTSVDVVPRDADISSRKTPIALMVPIRKNPCRKRVKTTGKHDQIAI